MTVTIIMSCLAYGGKNMRQKSNTTILLAVVLAATLAALFSGCEEPTLQTAAVGPGQTNVIRRSPVKTADSVNRRNGSMVPVQADGKLVYRDTSKGGNGKPEKLNVKMRFCPPYDLFFRGDNILGEAVRLGSNQDEFWFRVKPKEVSTYWSGRRSQAQVCPNQLWLSPSSLLDALGAVNIGRDWAMSKKGNYDVFTKIDAAGKPQKRVYVNRRSNYPEQIYYYNASGKANARLLLSNYINTSDGISIPGKINITQVDYSGKKSEVDISFRNVKRLKKMNRKLFQRVSSRGIKNIYRLDNRCQFVRQRN